MKTATLYFAAFLATILGILPTITRIRSVVASGFAAVVVTISMISVEAKADEFAPFLEATKQATFLVETDETTGSGVLINENIVVTNCHVVDTGGERFVNPQTIKLIQQPDDRTAVTYRVAGYLHLAPQQDLCFLRIRFREGDNLKPVTIGRSSSVKQLDKVWSVDHQSGEPLKVSSGKVTRKDHNVNSFNLKQLLNSLDYAVIKHDAPIEAGSSGGGLYNIKGELVGLTFAAKTTDKKRPKAGENLALPAEWIPLLLEMGNNTVDYYILPPPSLKPTPTPTPDTKCPPGQKEVSPGVCLIIPGAEGTSLQLSDPNSEAPSPSTNEESNASLPDCKANPRCLLFEDFRAAKKHGEFIAKWKSFTMADMATMINVGAKVHVREKYKKTPLHYAAWADNAEAVFILLKAGADVHAKDNQDLTPLYFVAYDNNAKVIPDLIKAGADVNAKTGGGWTPLDLAILHGHQVAINALKAVGVKCSKRC